MQKHTHTQNFNSSRAGGNALPPARGRTQHRVTLHVRTKIMGKNTQKTQNKTTTIMKNKQTKKSGK